MAKLCGVKEITDWRRNLRARLRAHDHGHNDCKRENVRDGFYDAVTSSIISTSPESHTSLSHLDSLGRVLRIEIPGLAPVAFAYDLRGHLGSITEGAGMNACTRSFTYHNDGYVGASIL